MKLGLTPSFTNRTASNLGQFVSSIASAGGGGGVVYIAGGDPNNPLDANLLNKQIMYLDPIANNGSTTQINSTTASHNYALTNVTIENSSNTNQPIAWVVDGTSLIAVNTLGYANIDDLFASAGFPTTDFDGDPSDTFALSVWIKTTNNSANGTVPNFAMGFTGDKLVDTYVGVGFDTGIPEWVAYRGTQIGWTNSSGSVGVSDGNWHHVVWAYDSIDNEYSTYIDKVKRSSAILGPWTNSSFFKLDYIGKAFQNSSFVGSIGALRFIFDSSNNKITQSEIDQLYQVDAWMY